jgi:monovalent cation:H+ antiporter-2, CPA2 family
MILTPRGQQSILAHDTLIVLGHEENMDAFIELVETTQHMEDNDVALLDNFELKAIVLDAHNPFIGKSIRDSQIREETNGLVVGLERANVRTLNPDVTIILEAGDLLLIVGEKDRLESLPE